MIVLSLLFRTLVFRLRTFVFSGAGYFITRFLVRIIPFFGFNQEKDWFVFVQIKFKHMNEV
jgi:hypothetical protein